MYLDVDKLAVIANEVTVKFYILVAAWDHCKLGNIEMHKIDTENQRADLLTKNLSRKSFEKHVATSMDTGRKKIDRLDDAFACKQSLLIWGGVME